VLVSRAKDRFEEEGGLSDDKSLELLKGLLDEFAAWVERHEAA
jgi:hypothetical protein